MTSLSPRQPLAVTFRRPRFATLVCCVALLGFAQPPAGAAAQQPPTQTTPAASLRADSAKSSARAELEARAASLEAAGKRTEAAELRRRLAEGDFAVGDRIVLRVTGSLVVDDTLPVREGLVITVPTLPDISMRGVLRSDLNDYLTRQISRYVRDPVVHASPLVRVAVSGSVARPGFYAMPPDISIGDAIMRAGGLTGESDMRRTVVKRGSSQTLSKGAVQQVVRNGTTLDQAGIRAGDEIVVGKRRNFSWTNAVFLASGLVSAVVGLVVLLNR